MRATTDIRNLPVKLTAEELETRSRELADAVKDEDGKRLEFLAWDAGMKEAKKDRRAQVTLAHAEASRLAEIVESGEERRNVPCSWLYHLAGARAFLVRDDTGELVTTRVLQEDERQTSLTEVLREPTPAQLAQWIGMPASTTEESVS